MSICGLEGGAEKLGGGLVSDLRVCKHVCSGVGMGGIDVVYLNKLLLRYYIWQDDVWYTEMYFQFIPSLPLLIMQAMWTETS